jgi:UPF0755 protein
MKKAGLVITFVLSLLAFAVGFGGVSGALMLTQPSVAGATANVKFVVVAGDTTASVADHLQKDGLIRNALLFRLYARYKHLDRGIEPGVYNLSPSMKLSEIIGILQQGRPDEVVVTVPDGLRVTQYPSFMSGLSNFNAQNFLQIAKTGKFLDGTTVSSQFWYVEPLQPHAVFALEGYLYPDTNYFATGATEKDVVVRMLTELGEKLCPGPAGQADAYISDHTQCRTHAVMVGSGTNIFDAMDAAYGTKDDVKALYDTLIIGSLTAREINNYNDALGVASTYHNRYLASQGKVQSDTAGYMGSDPSAEYARDTDNPPKPGDRWWADLGDAGKNVDPKNPYNTDNTNDPSHIGLPPGPIAAPHWQEIAAAAAPKDPSKWPYFYFVSDHCGNIHYAKTNADFGPIVAKYVNTKTCSTSIDS